MSYIKPDAFKEVIEGYFNGTNFYTDSGFTNLITPESGKIYINIAVTPATQYRWSGSAYVQIGGGGDTSKFIYRNTNKYSHTGTISDTLMFQTTIPANTISTGDLLEFIVYAYRVSGTGNNIFPRVKISNTNNFATATQIATTLVDTSSNANKIRRESMAINDKLRFNIQGANGINVDYTLNPPTLTDYTIDFTQDIYVFFSLFNQSATDVSEIEGAFIIQR